MTQQTLATARRSDELLACLADYQDFTVVTHDNPDPDAIAAGWGVCTLIEERLGKPVKLVGGGAIMRGENRHMVELLRPPIELIDETAFARRDATSVILVDCGPGSSNHLAARRGVRPLAVIDHHGPAQRCGGVPFVDVRPDVAASASLAAQYLREQKIEPGHKLATAMLYAIRTETCGYDTEHSALDRAVVRWLSERADPELLAEIESAPLTRAYYSDLALALQSTRIFGDTAFCLLPQAEGAETVGELADMLIRCQGVSRVLTGAVVRSDLVISVRTKREADDAARLVRVMLEGLGSGGGHEHRAGGQVVGVGGSSVSRQLGHELRRRWLDACGLPGAVGDPLVSAQGHPNGSNGAD